MDSTDKRKIQKNSFWVLLMVTPFRRQMIRAAFLPTAVWVHALKSSPIGVILLSPQLSQWINIIVYSTSSIHETKSNPGCEF